MEDRQILDAMFIANETIDSILKNNECGILCKLDIFSFFLIGNDKEIY